MKQEEKARAYDKAIEKIKYVMEHGVSPVLNKEDLQDIFPELRESEDERIRGAIIDHLKDNNLTEWAAWIEKQAPKQKWSEEDEEMLSEIITDVKFAQDRNPQTQMNQIIFEEEVNWLKLLKQRLGGDK